jgi:protocatechuate 3,4-dioxygenase beta subunit
MKKKLDAKDEEMIKGLGDLVKELMTNRSTGIDGLRKLQMDQQALLQREEARLSEKLGKDHPRVRRLKTRRAEVLDSIRNLDIEIETAKVDLPPISEEEILYYGRVVDEGDRGIDGMKVYLMDEDDQPLSGIKAVKTDKTGRYVIKVDPSKIEEEKILKLKLATEAPGKKEIIYRTADAVDTTPGMKVNTNFQINRLEVIGLGKLSGFERPSDRQPEKPVDPQKKPAGEAFFIRGVVKDSQGESISGVMVSVYDKDRKYDDKLGSAITNEEGEYTITYTSRDFKEGPEPGADLYLLVIDESGTLLYSSAESVRFDAGKEEVFDIVISSK